MAVPLQLPVVQGYLQAQSSSWLGAFDLDKMTLMFEDESVYQSQQL